MEDYDPVVIEKELEMARRRPVRVEVRSALSGWKSMADLETRVMALDAQIKDQEAEAAKVREALDALVTKIGEVHAHPAYQSVWSNGSRYKGPSYGPELDAAIAVLGEDQMSARDWNPAEALFAFAGELTTMYPAQIVGATSNAAPMADRVGAFIERHRLDDPRQGWENHIVPVSRAS